MKKIANIIAAASLAFILAGCAGTRVGDLIGTVSGATVPGYTVVAAVQSFDGLQLVGAAYLDLPRCTATSGVACRIPSATPVIKGAAQSGRIARNELKAQVRTACAADFAANRECSAGIPVASYSTLTAATKTIEDATAAYRAATGK